MKKITAIIDYLKQPSTLKGLVALAGLLGYAVTPEQLSAYALILPLIVGLFEVVRNEDKAK